MDEIRIQKVKTSGDTIRLDQFLKSTGIAGTGGHAKVLIQDGCVSVNGSVETHRGRKLKTGDKVSVDNKSEIVYEVMGDTKDAP